MKYTQEQVIELAKNVELEDAIDWSEVKVDRDRIYQIIGSQVYDYYSNWDADETQDKEVVMLAAITKLVIENFVLNVKLNSAY